MTEQTSSPYELCVYCKQPVERGLIVKRFSSGKVAHLRCYTDHLDDEEPESEE